MISAPLPAPRTVQTRRGAVTFAEEGEGQAVLALHGAMGAWDQGAILGRLAVPEGCRIIAPSRPGFPGTADQGDNGAQAQAALMIDLLDALGVTNCVVVAISGGGPCAVLMALMRPDLCRGLVLVSTVAGPNPVEIPRRFAVLEAIARVPGLPRLLQRWAVRSTDTAAARAFPDPEQREDLLRDPVRRALYRALTASTFEKMRGRLAASRNDFHVTATESLPLEDLRVPVLIAHGKQDPHVDFERHALAASRRIPRAELIALEGGGHAAIFTHAAAVKSAMTRFLRTLEGASAIDAGDPAG